MLFKNGCRIRSKYVQLIFLKDNETVPNRRECEKSKFAVCVYKKLGNSVKRNKAKRILREIFRRHQQNIKSGFKIVFIPETKWTELDFSGKENEIIAILKKARLLKIQDEFSGYPTD